jgi:hypothetical protein
MRAAKIIALLLPESHNASRDEFDVETATALMRDHDGRMTLSPLTHHMPFAEQVMTTGCFRRGKPIIDPVTRDVMGYEMEMVTESEMRTPNMRLQLGY